MLLVEDLHWVDDATVDVLAYLARRLEALPAVLVLTYRDDSVPAEHPARRLLGALAGGAGGPAAAGAAVRGGGRASWPPTPAGTRAVLHELSGGNPFYVTEALAAPGAEVPATVADAVLARLRRLGPRCREAVEQLSVVPTPVDFELAEALLGDRLDALTEAEDTGILRVRAGGLVFRHELARRAVEQSLSGLRRRGLHAAVVRRAAGARPNRSWPGWCTTPPRPATAATVSRFAPAGRPGGGGGRLAPAGAGALRRGAAARAPAGAGRAGPGRRRARLGAVQRAPLRARRWPRPSGRSSCTGGWPTGAGSARRWSGCPGTATWSATPPAPSDAAEEALRLLAAGDRRRTCRPGRGGRTRPPTTARCWR